MSWNQCVNCGRSLEIGARFCDGCGQPVQVRPATQAAPTQPITEFQRPSQPSLMRKPGPWVVVAVLLIVGLAVGFGIGGAIFSGTRSTATITEQSITTSLSTVQPQDILEACYSPGGNCASRIMYWIGRANSSIHIAVYSFTLDNVGDSLIQAKNRGIDIKIVMDDRQSASEGTASEYQKLLNASIQVRFDRRSALMHNKFAIIDGHIIITGSFNWSASANEDNNENLLIIDSQTWAARYEAEFQRVWTQYT